MINNNNILPEKTNHLHRIFITRITVEMTFSIALSCLACLFLFISEQVKAFELGVANPHFCYKRWAYGWRMQK